MELAPGWKNEIMKWCLEEAKKRGLKEEHYWGGFVIDEMKIEVQSLLYNFKRNKLMLLKEYNIDKTNDKICLIVHI